MSGTSKNWKIIGDCYELGCKGKIIKDPYGTNDCCCNKCGVVVSENRFQLARKELYS
ncbi:hypothetical protein KAS79_03835 [Candidatus Parcubacteria bacterium]|nr:hypothetical protein [Candidatus Parcubacteria bacterium]